MVDLLGNRLLGTKGLLTAEHPYHREAEVTHFLVRRGGGPSAASRAAVNRRFNEHYGSKIGFFGFFESENDHEVAARCSTRRREWLATRGMTAMRGPASTQRDPRAPGRARRGVRVPADGRADAQPALLCAAARACGLAKVEGLRRVHDRLRGRAERPALARLAAGVADAREHRDAHGRHEPSSATRCSSSSTCTTRRGPPTGGSCRSPTRRPTRSPRR